VDRADPLPGGRVRDATVGRADVETAGRPLAREFRRDVLERRIGRARRVDAIEVGDVDPAGLLNDGGAARLRGDDAPVDEREDRASVNAERRIRFPRPRRHQPTRLEWFDHVMAPARGRCVPWYGCSTT
jgi:hypothetical protein